jgi:hypothetical protein
MWLLLDLTAAGADALFRLYYESAAGLPPCARPFQHYGWTADLSSALAQDTWLAFANAARGRWHFLDARWRRVFTNGDIPVAQLAGLDAHAIARLFSATMLPGAFLIAHLGKPLALTVNIGVFTNPCMGQDLEQCLITIRESSRKALMRYPIMTTGGGLNTLGSTILAHFFNLTLGIMQAALRTVVYKWPLGGARGASAHAALQYLIGRYHPAGGHIDVAPD